jgi:hypothetical protein
VDCAALLSDFLVVPGTSLYERCGDRIYVGRCADGFLNEAPAVRVIASGGGDRTINGGVFRPRFYVLCYGGTGMSHNYVEARATWQALSDRLHGALNASLSRGLLASAWGADPGEEVIDSETEWAAVGTFYTALMKEVS